MKVLQAALMAELKMSTDVIVNGWWAQDRLEQMWTDANNCEQLSRSKHEATASKQIFSTLWCVGSVDSRSIATLTSVNTLPGFEMQKDQHSAWDAWIPEINRQVELEAQGSTM